jgi:hypothetical protein
LLYYSCDNALNLFSISILFETFECVSTLEERFGCSKLLKNKQKTKEKMNKILLLFCIFERHSKYKYHFKTNLSFVVVF